jgi:inhibitor of KinA
MPATIEPLGDSAVVITFGDEIDETINQQVLCLFRYLKEKKIPGVKDILPAYASLAVIYDIMVIKKMFNCISAFDHIRNEMERALQDFDTAEIEAAKIIFIPACYDVSLGIDLEEMSIQKNIPVEDIIQMHHSATYRVYMTGFMPGFPYMGKVSGMIASPRKAAPRKFVGAGSIGIAGFQTGIYPFDSPGGWNIVGQTPMQMFNAHYEPPCMLAPGDHVQFVPISLEEFHELKR